MNWSMTGYVAMASLGFHESDILDRVCRGILHLESSFHNPGSRNNSRTSPKFAIFGESKRHRFEARNQDSNSTRFAGNRKLRTVRNFVRSGTSRGAEKVGT